ncbi:MAG: ABC transporter permease, partial [Bryobacteraceae bacterium]|nr:ABC transporter permease [Bryobacteraceae bacterium]
MDPSLISELVSLSLEHLALVAASIGIAVAVSLPAAVFLARHAMVRRYVLN